MRPWWNCVSSSLRRNRSKENEFTKFISYIEALTKLLASDVTKLPHRRMIGKKIAANKRCKLCVQFHKNPHFLGAI